ncbi:MAG TPA: 2-C-methyl-D-erythritol 4-phosphate cytidylyltransferase [Steroidobacteraceae bacterium]|jgi:2-C-methyl-D-erythritol 4-phosphate cytidylyltransferase|nr:2-C-methyl-D-erythritol 4-phosphate cytidylyltransferase [Steroidobacteraceae bacterium]
MTPMRYWLVMPAAGSGRRFGGAKQYAALGARTVLDTALQLFIEDPRCAGGSLVLSAQDPHRRELSERLAPRFQVVDGGAERAHSVCNGLAALAERAREDDWVLVHDAARPCLSAADLSRLLEHAEGEPVGALLAAPIVDTLRRAAPAASAAAAPRSLETLPRDSLWLAQTPQMFRLAPLRHALERAIELQRAPTDEAQAMEWQGLSARLVAARDGNLKVTSASDLALAEAILAARRKLACG